MNDAEYERLRDQLDALVDLWKERWKLRNWRISCYYYRTAREFEAGAPVGVGQEAGACCDSKWQYFDAALHFNLEIFPRSYPSYEDREEVVAHELAHCVLDELYKSSPASDGNSPYEKGEWAAHNERVTSHMTFAILQAFRPEPVEGVY